MDQKQEYTAPVGGQNDRLSPLMVPREQAVRLYNFMVNERGILEKAKGFLVDGSPFPDDPSSFIRMLLNYKRGTDTDVLLMAAIDPGNENDNYKVDLKQTTGNGFYYYIGHREGTASFTNNSTTVTGGGTFWASHLKAGDKIKALGHGDDKYAEIQSVNSNGNLTLVAPYTGDTVAGTQYIARIILHKDFTPRGVVFDNKAIIVNGSETPMLYDGTSLGKHPSENIPTASLVEIHKNRAFFAKDSNIYWTRANNLAVMDAESFEPIFPQDNGNIVEIKSYADSLIVLKDNGNIYQVVGNFADSVEGSPDYIRKIDAPETIGQIVDRSSIVHNNSLYFICRDGVYQLDPRLFVSKVSSDIDNFMKEVTFALGVNAPKAFTFTTNSAWDAGIHLGTKAVGNKLTTYFDQTTITGAHITRQWSIAVDNLKTVHIVHVTGITNPKVLYTRWDIDGSKFTEIVMDYTGHHNFTVRPSIALAPSGAIGIAVKAGVLLEFTEKKPGEPWPDPITGIVRISPDSFSHGYINPNICLRYNSNSEPRVATVAQSNDLIYLKRVNNTWSQTVVGNLESESSVVSMLLDPDNPRISVHSVSIGKVSFYSSNNDGATWNRLDEISEHFNLSRPGTIQLSKKGTDFVSIFEDHTGAVFKRNHTTQTTTVLRNQGEHLIDGILHPDDGTEYMYFVKIVSGIGIIERIVYNGDVEINNPSVGVIRDFRPCDRAIGYADGVFAFSAISTNYNELIVRRISFVSEWVSDEKTAPDFLEWGEFKVAGLQSNGNSVSFSVAVKDADDPEVFEPITPGQLINGTPDKNRIKVKVKTALGAWAAAELAGISLGYKGIGFDTKKVAAVSHNNELFYSLAQAPSEVSNRVLVLDKGGAFIINGWPVSAMARFKNKIYAGRSTNGDLLILNEGFKYGEDLYDAEFISKEDLLGSYHLEKDIYKIYVIYENKPLGSFTFSFRTNSFKNFSGSDWQNFTIDQTGSGVAEIDVGQRAHSIQYKITNDGFDQQVGIIGWVVIFNYLNLR